jgi:hypothetical protein
MCCRTGFFLVVATGSCILKVLEQPVFHHGSSSYVCVEIRDRDLSNVVPINKNNRMLTNGNTITLLGSRCESTWRNQRIDCTKYYPVAVLWAWCFFWNSFNSRVLYYRLTILLWKWIFYSMPTVYSRHIYKATIQMWHGSPPAVHCRRFGYITTGVLHKSFDVLT